jgi:exodeoxyribonuclease VII small subunit
LALFPTAFNVATQEMPKVESNNTELSFESAMERLEKIVEQMESSKLPLEELIVRYEEGIKLVAVCNDRLAAAENRIETLNRSSTEKLQSGHVRTSDPTNTSYDETSLF